MAECFIVFTGGSGSMVLESLVHMAAVSAIDYDVIHMLMMDVDQGNGNVARASTTVKHYCDFRESMNSAAVKGLFKSELKLYSWMPYHINSVETRDLQGMIEDEDDALWLARALYTEDEIRHEVSIGFKGHPNLGVLFLENLFSGVDENNGLTDFIRAFVAKKADRLMLVGSCFGGTGASSIPVFGRYLRKRIKAMGGRDFSFALLALQPYFTLPESEEKTLMIDSDKFADKVKTVLSYYPQTIMKPDAINPLYQHVYLLGSQERVHFPVNSSGTNKQENPANIITWFACVAIKQFFSITESKMLVPSKAQLHLPWLTKSTWEWDQFSSSVFPALEQNCAMLLQVAMLYICKLHDPVLQLGKEPQYSFFDNMLRDYSTQQRVDFGTNLKTLTDYLARYVNWFFQIVTHLPKDGITDTKLDETRKEYAAFHTCKYELVQKAFEEDNPIPPDGNKEESDAQRRLRKYRTVQLDSLFHQKFLNAFLICKLENKRMEYWPFEGQARELDDNALAHQTKANRDDAQAQELAERPLAPLINEIVNKRFLTRGANLESMLTYMQAQEWTNATEIDKIYRLFVKSLFGAVTHFQQ